MTLSNYREFLIVDDHGLIRASLVGILENIFHSPTIYEAADSSEALLLASQKNNIDVVLLDLMIPGIDGVSLLPQLKDYLPKAIFTIITAKNTDIDIQALMDLGVTSIIPKSTGINNIRDNLVMNLTNSNALFDPMRENVDTFSTDEVSSDRNHAHDTLKSLTLRQKQILKLVSNGSSNKQISQEIYLAEGTVKNHISAIFHILNVRNRTEAAFIAKKHQLF